MKRKASGGTKGGGRWGLVADSYGSLDFSAILLLQGLVHAEPVLGSKASCQAAELAYLLCWSGY